MNLASKTVSEQKMPCTLDRIITKATGLVFSYLRTCDLLSYRLCCKAQLAQFHAAAHWDNLTQRLVVELHASRMTLETAHQVIGASKSSSHPTPPRRLVPTPLAVGHRGAPGGSGLKGNSLESFHHAVAIGADMIELDVCIDRSGDVVVHHDLYLSDGRLLETLTLAEIKRVAPEVEPLSVVLRELRAYKVSLYLDIKTDRVVAPLMRLLHEAISKDGWAPARLLIASFNQYDMIEVNAHRLAYPTLSEVQTCIIVDGVPIALAKEYAALDVKWCSIGDGCVLPSFLHDAHSRGIGVMVWTVNNPDMMRRYLTLGVDAVVSDYPERIVAVRDDEEDTGGRTANVSIVKEGVEEDDDSSSIMSTSPPSSSSSSSSSSNGACYHPHHSHAALLSAYPTPLHQPRTRLVRALHQALPLIRALEGRKERSPPSNNKEESKASPVITANEKDHNNKATTTHHVHHLRAAARQAEESATAVLQPRLPEHPLPKTPPRGLVGGGLMEGGGGKSSSNNGQQGKKLSSAPPAFSPMPSSSHHHHDLHPHDDEDNHAHFFLPFERLWAREVS